MRKKVYTEGNRTITHYYQGWGNVLWEGLCMSFFYLLASVCIFVLTPFMTVRAMFCPEIAEIKEETKL